MGEIYLLELVIDILVKVKDCLPHLFHAFGNKHFYKISLETMLYFHYLSYRFNENA